MECGGCNELEMLSRSQMISGDRATGESGEP